MIPKVNITLNSVATRNTKEKANPSFSANPHKTIRCVIEPAQENLTQKAKCNFRKPLLELAGAALIFLVPPVLVGKSMISYADKKYSDVFPVVQTDSIVKEDAAVKAQLRERLNNMDVNSAEAMAVLSDIAKYRLQHSKKNDSPVLYSDIQLFKEYNFVTDDDAGLHITKALRPVLTFSKKNPEIAEKLAYQLSYLINNKTINNFPKENYPVIADFLLEPTRKPSKEEITEMRNSLSISPTIPTFLAGFLSLIFAGLFFDRNRSK